MVEADRSEIEARWKREGFSCALWVDPPGTRWEDFTHRVDEIVMVVEGRMEFEVAGAVVHPAPGEEVLIPAGAVHSVRNLGSTTARWLYGYRSR